MYKYIIVLFLFYLKGADFSFLAGVHQHDGLGAAADDSALHLPAAGGFAAKSVFQAEPVHRDKCDVKIDVRKLLRQPRIPNAEAAFV